MRMKLLLLFIFLLPKSAVISQITVANPSKNDFSGTLSFLASEWMQGRGSAQKGGFMAADYIASMMQLYQLVPYQNKSDYFQDFKIQEHSVKKASLSIHKNNDQAILLVPETDFSLTPISKSLDIEAQVQFLGYGLQTPNAQYDDYKEKNVKGKIVVVLKGFPSHLDSTTVTYRKFKKIFPEENDLEETKLNTAIKQGAIALIIVDLRTNLTTKATEKNTLFHSLENTIVKSIPVFKLNAASAEKLLGKTVKSIIALEKIATQKQTTPSIALKNTTIYFSIALQSETLAVRNVLGMIKGQDTTKTIIVGAHYDHLGIQNDSIYYGADDNASGTSGMLALAKNWSESKTNPPYNMVFASWTAEEMGLLGSEYFVRNLDLKKQNILLAINMDMISRNAPEDKTHRILSIGIQKENPHLKEIANLSNRKLSKPFLLDLWETNGHSGSDYASFTNKGIPIMTFFSGFHSDYHTPGDVATKIDSDKVKDVLFIVNTSLIQFIENQTKLIQAKP